MLRSRFLLLHVKCSLPCSSNSLATSVAKSSLTVQPAIKRSPTDLLEALSSTVGVDVTAPHFQFIDDPTTIPTTVANQRNYYMAKELGKRAARQLAEEWPTLFAFDRDQPELPAFRPQKMADPMNMELTEESLLVLVKNRSVKDACVFYERLRGEGKDVSEEAKLALFNLTAYYNGEDPPFAELEEWHGLRNFAVQERHQWTHAGVADILYESLPPSPSLQSTMIAALCKHLSQQSKQRAHRIFQELYESGSAATAEAYSALIRVSNWEQTTELLQKMAASEVRPTLEVWESACISASKISSLKKRSETLGTVMREAMNCGEKELPLSVYNTTLNALYDLRSAEKESSEREGDHKRLGEALHVLVEFLRDLECRPTIKLSSSSDGHFFMTAVSLCARAGNLPLAKRVIDLYEGDRNQVKLPAIGDQGIMYTSLLMLAAEKESSIESFHDFYIAHVPRLVGMSRTLAMTVIQRLQMSACWPLLFRVTGDCIAARLSLDGRVMQGIRQLLINSPYQSLSPIEREQYSSLIDRLVSISLEFSQFTDPRSARLQYKQNPLAISELALLLSRVGETQRALELLNLLLDEDAVEGEAATVGKTGYARLTAMSDLFEDALRRSDAYAAATCLEIMSGQLNRHRVEQYAHRIIERCTLTESQTRILKGFVRLRPQ